MEKINFDSITNDLVKGTMLNLRGILMKNFPEVVDFNSFEITENDDFYEIFVKLKRQFFLETFTPSLEKNLNIHILVAASNWEKSSYKVIGYHKPVEGEMYTVLIDSSQYGVIESLTFRVYESIEIMLYDLQSEKKKIPHDWNILEQQNNKDMLSLFVS